MMQIPAASHFFKSSFLFRGRLSSFFIATYNMVAVKYIFQSVEAKQSVEGGNRSTRLSQQGGEQPPAKKRPSLPTPQKPLPAGTSAVNGTF